MFALLYVLTVKLKTQMNITWIVITKNWLVRIYKDPRKKKKKKKEEPKIAQIQSKQWHFHNHLTTDQGVDLREKREEKSTTFHRAVVPNAPILSRRFYDWPPNPSLSKVEIYKAKEE